MSGPAPTKLLAYQSVLAALANGRPAIAAHVLRSLSADDLMELQVICDDARTMVDTDARRRVDESRSS